MIPVVDDVGDAVGGGLGGYVAECCGGSAYAKQTRGEASLVPSRFEVEDGIR